MTDETVPVDTAHQLKGAFRQDHTEVIPHDYIPSNRDGAKENELCKAKAFKDPKYIRLV